jgi:dihydroflavonol-4-reductase
MKGRVLVTGINGFLGSHIVSQLLDRGYTVRGTMRDPTAVAKVPYLSKLGHRDRLEIVQADLLRADTWKPALAGCMYVIHAASPFPVDTPKDESVLVQPAVEGTRTILGLCEQDPEVKAVVMTSSIVSIISLKQPVKPCYTEDDWAEVDNIPYNKSKVLAEQTAWEMYKSLDKSKRYKLSVINPGFILGPSLVDGMFTSGQRIKKLMNGEFKYLMKLSASIVDVRDVAAAHIAALESSVSDGQRYICCSGETLWYSQIADILRAEFGARGYTIPSHVLPDCPISDPTSPLALYWDKRFELSNAKIRKDLGLSFIPAKESILQMAHSLIDNGMLPNLPTLPKVS